MHTFQKNDFNIKVVLIYLIVRITALFNLLINNRIREERVICHCYYSLYFWRRTDNNKYVT